ncbi:MAG: helix-turn-helix domain-containing protein [Pseudomonadota bacterium]
MLDIGEVSRRCGQPPSTLRYYEERGLIRSTGRHGLRRLYGEDVLEQLALIALGRGAGFSLDEIKEMLTNGDGRNVDRNKLRERADQLDGLIQKLTVVRDSLRSTADCPAPSHMECKNFQRIVSAAGKGKIEPLQRRPFDR